MFKTSALHTVMLALICSTLAAGCIGNDLVAVKGSGVAKSESRELGQFRRIELNGAANLDVTVGPETSVTVETDDNLLEIIQTEVAGGTLTIRSTEPYSTRLGVRVRITTPALAAVTVAGSGDVKVAQLRGGSLEVQISGSGDVHASGEVEQARFTIRGSGGVNAGQLRTREVRVAIQGSGEVEVNASERLDVSIAGSGEVRYTGDPKVEQRVAGSGRVRRVG